MSKRYKDAEKYSKGSNVRHKENMRDLEGHSAKVAPEPQARCLCGHSASLHDSDKCNGNGECCTCKAFKVSPEGQK
jgi:hypothetical protein